MSLTLVSGGVYVVKGEDALTQAAEGARGWVLESKAKMLGDGSPVLAVPDTELLNGDLGDVPYISVEPMPQAVVDDFDTFVRDRVISNGGVWPETSPLVGSTADSFWSVVGARYGLVAPEDDEVVRGTEVLLERAGVDLDAVVWDETGEAVAEGKPLYRWHYRVGDLDLPMLGGTALHGDRLMSLAFDAVRLTETGTWDREDLLTLEESFDKFRHLDYRAVGWDTFSYDWPLDKASFTSATLTQTCLFIESATSSCGARMSEGGTYALTPVWVLYDPLTVKPLVLPAVRDLGAWVNIANAKPWAKAGAPAAVSSDGERTDEALREELFGTDSDTEAEVRPAVDLRPSRVKQMLDVRSPHFSLNVVEPGYVAPNSPPPAPVTWMLRARVKKAQDRSVSAQSGPVDIDAARRLVLAALTQFGIDTKQVRFIDDPALRPDSHGVVLRWSYRGGANRQEGDLAMPEVDGVANISADTFFRDDPDTWLLMDFDVLPIDLAPNRD